MHEAFETALQTLRKGKVTQRLLHDIVDDLSSTLGTEEFQADLPEFAQSVWSLSPCADSRLTERFVEDDQTSWPFYATDKWVAEIEGVETSIDPRVNVHLWSELYAD